MLQTKKMLIWRATIYFKNINNNFIYFANINLPKVRESVTPSERLQQVRRASVLQPKKNCQECLRPQTRSLVRVSPLWTTSSSSRSSFRSFWSWPALWPAASSSASSSPATSAARGSPGGMPRGRNPTTSLRTTRKGLKTCLTAIFELWIVDLYAFLSDDSDPFENLKISMSNKSKACSLISQV